MQVERCMAAVCEKEAEVAELEESLRVLAGGGAVPGGSGSGARGSGPGQALADFMSGSNKADRNRIRCGARCPILGMLSAAQRAACQERVRQQPPLAAT
jgi:hypothetical protein